MLLSVGTRALAAKGAIVKRIRSVETANRPRPSAPDKTGTLTLSQMTARELVVGPPASTRRRRGLACLARSCGWPVDNTALAPFVLPMALANDAVIRDGASSATPPRAPWSCWPPRPASTWKKPGAPSPLGEVPFDAEYKLMATFHAMEDAGRPVVRCFVKGAPDVLLARSRRYLAATGHGPDGRRRRRGGAENDRLASEGLRVLAVARRDFDPATFDPAADLLTLVEGLDLLALIGIVDPPRKEAKDAIVLCKDAGIRVRMITGDHATTASAIAAQLGIEGRASPAPSSPPYPTTNSTPRSTASAWSPAPPPKTRSGWSASSKNKATSSP